MLRRCLRLPSSSLLSSRLCHTVATCTYQRAKMKILQVPVLDDNYSYLLIDEEQGVAASVDPAVPSAMLAAAEKENVRITTVLTTHHHWDHAQGNEEMASKLPGVAVVGGDDRIPAMTQKVGEGDTVQVGGITVKVLFTPCHTTGHVLYLAEHPGKEAPALFSGDTLFVGGCGKFFEGNGEQMYDALCKKIPSLPHETEVHCGHEYTVSNLRFAHALLPECKAVKEKLEWAEARREQNLTTVPSTIGEELLYNPFMRCDDPAVKEATGLAASAAGAEVMAKVRDMKNNGKGRL